LSEADLADPGMSQQEIWRKQLEAAELKYEEASAQLQAALEQGYGVAEARQRKMLAQVEYLRILRIFSDLVLRGRDPDPEEDPLPPKT
jgi:hypothetical protein